MSGENSGGEGEGPSGPPPRPEPKGQTEGGIEQVTRELDESDLQDPEGYEAPEAGPEQDFDLEDAIAGDIEPEEEPQPDEETAEEPEAEGEEPDEARPTRYRDPETGQFISEEEAREKGLDPEELDTLEGEADDFFGEDEEETPEEETEEPEVEPVELELDEDESLQIEAEDEETREYLEQLKEDAERGRNVREERAEIEAEKEKLEADRQELQLIERSLREDPSGFLLSNVPDDTREDLLRDMLLLDDELAQEAQSWLNDWSRDPKERELQKERRRRERTEQEYETGKRTPKAQAERARREKAEEIIGEVQRCIPEGAPESRAEKFIGDAVADIQRYINQNEMYPGDFDLDMVPELIEDRIELYGFQHPDQGEENPTDVPEAEPANEAAKELSERTERYRRTGERLRKAHARRESAATSPAGTGGQPSRPTRELQDATLDEALDAAERAAG